MSALICIGSSDAQTGKKSLLREQLQPRMLTGTAKKMLREQMQPHMLTEEGGQPGIGRKRYRNLSKGGHLLRRAFDIDPKKRKFVG